MEKSVGAEAAEEVVLRVGLGEEQLVGRVLNRRSEHIKSIAILNCTRV